MKMPAPCAWVERHLCEVVPDIRQLRMPLETGIDHSHVYLIRDEGGWCAFDSGFDSKAARDIWSAALAGPLKEGLTRIIVSHHHPDHLGLAAWLQKITGAPVYVRPEELAAARAMGLQEPEEEDAAREYYHRNGMTAADVEATIGFMRTFCACAIPLQTLTLEHGQRLRIGRYTFEVLVTGGHSDAQVALYDPPARFFLSGDQMLERITSNVGLWHFGDPASLANYFNSLDEIASRVIRLVLPAHHDVYETDGSRPGKLRAHHDSMLFGFRRRLQGWMTGFELSEVVFGKYSDIENRILALVETLAHLEWLRDEGLVVRHDDEQTTWYELRNFGEKPE